MHKRLTDAPLVSINYHMPRPHFAFPNRTSTVVGSFGDLESLISETPASLSSQCDLVEIRLDLFHEEFQAKGASLWKHLEGFPKLFTARRHSEGSPFDLDADTRSALLRAAIPDATLIDIEVASIGEMSEILSEIAAEKLQWIASFHDFKKLPPRAELTKQVDAAKAAGANAFKVAAMLLTIDDLTELAHFQISEQGIPLSTMGMGVLAPVSRLLCAQAGSVLNYGYMGGKTTAPGQWSAGKLRDCILSLNPIH
jgi:3-dehydroquinate dehydratase type I